MFYLTMESLPLATEARRVGLQVAINGPAVACPTLSQKLRAHQWTRPSQLLGQQTSDYRG